MSSDRSWERFFAVVVAVVRVCTRSILVGFAVSAHCSLTAVGCCPGWVITLRCCCELRVATSDDDDNDGKPRCYCVSTWWYGEAVGVDSGSGSSGRDLRDEPAGNHYSLISNRLQSLILYTVYGVYLFWRNAPSLRRGDARRRQDVKSTSTRRCIGLTPWRCCHRSADRLLAFATLRIYIASTGRLIGTGKKVITRRKRKTKRENNLWLPNEVVPSRQTTRPRAGCQDDIIILFMLLWIGNAKGISSDNFPIMAWLHEMIIIIIKYLYY